MKKAVVTIACGDFFRRMATITHPTIKAYAERIGAEFIIWDDYTGHTIPHYKKLELGQLLERYDRVLYIDTDILVRDDAPDIFELVPENELGILAESKYFDRTVSVRNFMKSVRYDVDHWDGTYYNTGVMVLSKVHQDLFVQPPVEWHHFKEQTFLNTLISDRKTKVFQLPHRFNRLHCMDRVYGEERFDAYFVHYAGMADQLSEDQQIRLLHDDFAILQAARPTYRFAKNIAFIVEGGLGDQVSAEPALRYACDVFREENMAIVSRWPEVFRHLGRPIFPTLETVPTWVKCQVRRTQNLEGQHGDSSARRQIHGVNLASLNALGIELPQAYKRPRLVVDPAAREAVIEKVRPQDVGKLVLLHPGRSSPANTFPADVWQSYLDMLVDHGFPAAVIGKRIAADRGVVEIDASKCLDLVDQLSVAELIALVAEAKVLVSNDSAPVQIAGAFDGWIGLIATSRRPEHVLHARNGSPFWRAPSLERLGLYEDYMRQTSLVAFANLDRCTEGHMRQCLSEPRKILEFVAAAFEDRDD